MPSTNTPCCLEPISLSISSQAPCRLEIAPCRPFDCFSSIPLNVPPSPAAWAKASATMSAEIAPADISSLSSEMLLPVIFDISTRGLKPALIICNRSCPISLPVEDICEKASTSELNFSLLPIEISPICRSMGMTFSASTLKPRSVCAPLARSPSCIGVLTAKSLISPKNSFALSLLPNRVSKDISRASISPRVLITELAKE